MVSFIFLFFQLFFRRKTLHSIEFMLVFIWSQSENYVVVIMLVKLTVNMFLRLYIFQPQRPSFFSSNGWLEWCTIRHEGKWKSKNFFGAFYLHLKFRNKTVACLQVASNARNSNITHAQIKVTFFDFTSHVYVKMQVQYFFVNSMFT